VPEPVDLNAVLVTALLNPAVVVVALWMGAAADQLQKLPLAAFAAAAAGSAVIYVAMRLGLPGVAQTARAPAGVFVAQFVVALAWAYIGYRSIRPAGGMSGALRLWLWVPAIGLMLLAVWAFVPVLIFFVLLTAALGILAAGMIDLAHRLPRWTARTAAAWQALARRLRAGHERH
jgi:hypothetical protein